MRAQDEPGGYTAMTRLTRTIRHLTRSAIMLCTCVITAAGSLRLCLRAPTALTAENLFLREQVALYQARQVKPRRTTDAIRVVLVWLSQWFDPMVGRHASLILLSPLESRRSTGSMCALWVLRCVGGRGPAFTRGVPSP
jgi:hypothetical protein